MKFWRQSLSLTGVTLSCFILAIVLWLNVKVSWHESHRVMAGMVLDSQGFDYVGRIHGQDPEILVWKKAMIPRWLLFSGPFIVLTKENMVIIDSTYDFGDDPGFRDKWTGVGDLILKERE